MQRLDVMISLLEKGRFESLRLNADPIEAVELKHIHYVLLYP